MPSPLPDTIAGTVDASFVVMGRVAASFGVKGWLKVLPLSADPHALLAHDRWFCKAAAGAEEWTACRVLEARGHGATLVAHFEGIDSPEVAQQWRGREIALPRAALPAPADDEIYIADLVGLGVVNREGIELGKVTEVRESGAHPLLHVAAPDGRVRLIPYVGATIDGIDRAARTIVVDWGVDY